MRRKITWISVFMFAVALSLVIVYFALRALAVEWQNYSWSEMDWNQDGKTTISEYLMSSEIGNRSLEEHGESCIEYFNYKDGSPIAVICKQDSKSLPN